MKNIYKDTKIYSTQQKRTHNVWLAINNYQACILYAIWKVEIKPITSIYLQFYIEKVQHWPIKYNIILFSRERDKELQQIINVCVAAPKFNTFL